MAQQPRRHHLVEFASRFGATRFKTLNASAAIWRAETLVSDAEALIDLRDNDADYFFGTVRNTYEIINYFAVGLVTCLEWHARSRLVDVMTYRPSCIQANELKNVGTAALSQMVAEGVTVPYLLGAAIHVSRIDEYIEVFKRVFNELGFTEIIERKLREEKTDIDLYRVDADNSLYGVLKELFELRNELVHEIGLSVIGHHSLRDVWEPERAVEFGKAAVAAMKVVEAAITQYSPEDFPNRIGQDGYAEDELEKLKTQITTLETELGAMLVGWEGLADGLGDAWIEARRASAASQEKELAFIEAAEFLRPVRHLDARREVQIEFLKTRLSYLKLLRAEAQGDP